MKTRYTFEKAVLLILFMVLSVTSKVEAAYVYGPTQYLTLCPNQAIDYRGHLITEPGIYRDTLWRAVNEEKDSIVVTVVNRGYMYFFDQTGSLTENGGKYWWRGRNLTQPGEYFDSLHTVSGCDSIYHITLLQKNVHYIDQKEAMCASSLPYRWHGRDIWSGGTYYDYFATSEMTDSVYRLELTVYETALTYLHVDLCPGETFMWNGSPITSPGVYDERTLGGSHLTRFGCDSVCILIVNEAHSYYFREEGHLNNHGVYAWHGKKLTREGVYFDSLKSVGGCDSIYELTLHKNPSYYVEEEKTICQTEVPYAWHGQNYYKAGVYYDSLTTRMGNDSVFKLTLTINPVKFAYRTAEICAGESLRLSNGREVSQPGLYDDTIRTDAGCDSICRIKLSVKPVYLFERHATMNPGGTYTWRGRNLTQAGVYYDSLYTKGSNPCDSIYKLTLHENPVFYAEESYKICQNEVPFNWHGNLYYTTGVYYDNLKSVAGVDSVYKMTLTVGATYEWVEYIDLCDGQTFNFHGTPITTPGVYHDTLVARNGCDSVRTVVVNRIPGYLFREYHTMAEGDTYYWHTQYITKGGYYEDAHLTKQGCDSIYSLYVTMWPTYHLTIEDTICANDLPYHFGGRDLYESGEYDDYKLTVHGYDSVTTLKLVVLPRKYGSRQIELCPGESVTLSNGKVVTKPDVYWDTIPSLMGCDSICRVSVKYARNYLIERDASINPGGTYAWRGRTLTQAGVYYDSLLTTGSTPCDSVYKLTLHENPVFYKEEEYRVCDDKLPFKWHNKFYYTQGVYYDSLKSVPGADSVYKMTLILGVIDEWVEHIDLCDGQTFNFHGKPITEPGIYGDTLTSSSGCDSIRTVIVNRIPGYIFREYHTMAEGDTYEWHGKTITEAGYYEDAHQTKQGCDSTYSLYVTTWPTYHWTIEDTVCANDLPYIFAGRKLYASGTYTDYHQTVHGYDSTTTLTLTVLPMEIVEHTVDLCSGETYNISARAITKSGIYYDTVHTEHGCWHVDKYIVNVHPVYYIADTISIGDQEAITWHGQTIDHAGTYRDPYTSAYGCDSVYILAVTVWPTYYMAEEQTVCQSELPITWHNQKLYAAGTYYDRLFSSHGTDSVYALTLNVLPTRYSEEYVEICEGDVYSLNGVELTAPNVYYDTIKTHDGCDSIHRLVLNLARSYFYDEVATMNTHGQYTWHGKTYTHEGVYYDSAFTTSGCDSIYRLTLTENKTYYFERDTAICERDAPLEWQGRLLYNSGTYYDSLKTRVGNDSVYVINLTIHPTRMETKYVSLCPGQTLSLRWQEVKEPGVFYDTIPSYTGCDSIVMYVVNFARNYLFETDATMHGLTSYEWRGHIFYHGGIYYDNYVTKNGCDSVYRLILHENPVYYLEEENTICYHEAPFLWRNRMLYESGVYYDTIPTAHGTDSVYKLTLTVNPDYLMYDQIEICPNQTFDFRGKTITEPGVYYDSLFASTGCDSVYMLVVNYLPSYVYETKVQISDQDTYTWRGNTYSSPGVYEEHIGSLSGCDSIQRLLLDVYPTFYIHESFEMCEGGAYTWRGNTYRSSGIYYDRYKTIHGYDSIFSLELTVHPKYVFTSQAEICAGDSLMWRGMKLKEANIYSDTLLTIGGCDSIFNMVLNVASNYVIPVYGEVCEGEKFLFRNISYTPGIYYDTIRTHSGCDSVFHIVVNQAPRYHKTLQYQLCPGETMMFQDKLLAAPNVYNFTYKTQYGCDSSYTIIVNEAPHYYFRDTIDLRNNESVLWHGQTIHTAGTYYDRQQTVHGCDSIYELTARIHPVYVFEETLEACENKVPVKWRGSEYSLTGDYYESYRTVDGFDSTYVLHLTIHSNYTFTEYKEICPGTTLNWRGQVISAAGIYTDLLSTVYGCDSTYKLIVNVGSSYYYKDTIDLADNQTITWHGQTISGAGTYYDRKTSVSGCDSIYELLVNVWPTFLHVENVTICDNQGGYKWERDGNIYTHTGRYYQRYKTSHGMDSVYCLNLTVNKTYLQNEYIQICYGETINYRGRSISEQCDYYDTLYTKTGCDSVFHVWVTQMPRYFYQTDAQLNKDGRYEWRGHIYTERGVYYDSLRSVNGCDSVFQLTLHENPVYYFDEADTVCQSDAAYPYKWHDKVFFESGIYYDSLKTFVGRDSVYRLTLTVWPKYIIEHSDILCHNSEYYFRGKQITEAGVYYDTMYSVHGCDSIFKLVLSWAPSYHYEEQMTLCDGDEDIWHGQVINHAGTYFDRLRTINGCDSIFELHVTLAPRFYEADSVVVCENELPHVWHGKNYYESGIYWDSCKTVEGCDSVYRHAVTVRPAYYEEVHVSFCQEDGATFRDGDRFYDRRIIDDTLYTVSGCDSIVRYVFEPNPTYLFETDASFNPGGSYYWREKTYTHEGVYYDNFKTITGCDSIYKLTLHKNPVYYFEEEATTCTQDLPFVWHGNKYYYHSGVYYDSLSTFAGADSVYRLTLTVYESTIHEYKDTICNGGEYIWRGRHITTPGIYYDTLTSIHGCDSVESLVLNWTPSYWYIDTVTISDQETYFWRGQYYSIPGTYEETLKTYQGCDSVYRLYLIVRPTFYNKDSIVWCENDGPYYWHGNHYEESGIYYDRQRTRFGYDSIYELNLTVHKVTILEMKDTICQGGEYHWRGQVIKAPGQYVDTLVSIHGCDSIVRLTLNWTTPYLYVDTVHISDQETYTWREQQYSVPGTYEEVMKNYQDCDSIYRLVLYVHPTYYNKDSVVWCENDGPYMWHGRNYEESGIYYDSYLTDMGYDSIYELDLTIRPSYIYEERIELCANEFPYHYKDTLFYEPTVYYDSMKTFYGCDSVYRIVIDYARSYMFEEKKQICKGDYYEWRGQMLNKTGVYFDSLKTQAGSVECDSIYRLELTVNEPFHHLEFDTICGNEAPYIWRDQYLFDSGTYFDSLKTQSGDIGCDSVYELRLTVYPYEVSYDTIWVCHGTTETYRDSIITETSVFTDTTYNKYGCPKISYVVYDFYPSYYFYEEKNVCEEDTFIWHNQVLTYEGRYFDRLTSIYGCDSIYEINITFHRTIHRDSVIVICPDSLPYEWSHHGETLTFWRDTVIEEFYRTPEGCDSTFKFRLYLAPKCSEEDWWPLCPDDSVWIYDRFYKEPGHYSIPFTTDMSKNYPDSIYRFEIQAVNGEYTIVDTLVCSNELPFFYNDQRIDTAGVYKAHLMSNFFCDSVVELRVTVRPAYEEYQELFVCNNEPFYFRGEPVTKTGIYTDSLIASLGCDSIIHYVVNFVPTFFIEQHEYLNPNGTYDWHGKTYNRPGVYWDSCKTVHGCDSVYKLYLMKNDEYYFETSRTYCANDDSLPYFWRDRYYNTTGVYYDSLMTITGADSVYCLRLTVLETPFTSTRVNLCPGESFYFRGKQITEPGIYTDTMYTLNGCDSVVQYVVTQNPSFYFEETQYMNPGGSYLWHRDGYNVTLTKPGTYWDSCRTVLGCDSVYRLFLVENDYYYFETVRTFCANDVDSLPYRWRNHDYTATGIYYDSLKTRLGADSVYCLRLTVNETPFTSTRINLCPGESFYFRGEQITEPGIYTDTMYTLNGCDSVVQYVVTINPSFFFEETAYLNPGGKYLWHKNGAAIYLTEPGTYFDSCRTVLGCDSIYRLFLLQNDYYYFETVRTFCANDVDSLPYRWRGHDYSATGVYYDSLQTIMGRDSVYCLKLTVNPAPFISTRINLCRGEIFRFRGKNITQAGIYLDTLQTLHGCDSVVQYVVSFHPDFYFEKTDLINPGSTYTWHKNGSVRIIDGPGVYWDSCKAVSGCDSIYKLTLIENKTYYFIDRDTVCEDELPYLWHNRSYETTGTYFDNQKTYYGADSIYRLELVVYRKSFETRMYNLCPGEFYDFNGTTVSRPGVYYDTLFSSKGCDSIIELLVNHATTYVTERQLQICKDDTLRVMPGVEITRPGIYYDTLRTIAGCDSIFRYVVNVAESFFIERHATMNPGSTYEWHNCGTPVMLTEPGVYWDSCKAVSGCDSIWRLELNVNHEYTFREEKHLCINDSAYPYYWHGQTLYDSGIYYDSLYTFMGMDSVFVLELTIDSMYVRDEQVFICKGDTFYMSGHAYTEKGTYCDTLLSSVGCDSIVRLHLNHYPTFKYIEFRSYGINDDHEWQGMNITHTGIYTKRYGTVNGCDSIYELHATVYQTAFNDTIVDVCYGDVFYLNGIRIRKDGDYMDTLRTPFGQDSIICYHVRFHDEIPTTIIPIDMCQGDTLYINERKIYETGIYEDVLLSKVTGCDSVVRHIVNVFQTYVFDEYYSFCENTVFEWPNHPDPLRPGTNYIFDRPGTYYDSCLTVHGCDSIYVLHLTGKGFVEIDSIALVCYDELPYEYHDQTYWNDTTFHDTIHTVGGCDSIRHIHFVRTNKCPDRYEFETYCDNQLPVFGKDTIKESGTYRFQVFTNQGLDSVLRMVITIAPTSVDTVSISGCDLVEYYGYQFRSSTSKPYPIYNKSVFGCDSITYVNVTVNHSMRDRQDETSVTIFDYEAPYMWYSINGTKLGEYYTSGNYEVIGNTPEGCDRYYELHLNVIHTDTMIDIQDLVYCKGDTSGITVYGSTYYPTEDMEVTYHQTDRDKGISIVYKSFITVLSPTVLTDIYLPDGNICGDAYSFNLGFQVKGSMPQTYRVEFLDTYASQYELPGVSGQVSGTGIISVPMNHDHNCFVTPNYYHVRLTVDNVACGSVHMDTVLLIKYPSWIIEQNWNNVVAVLNNQTINAQTYCGNYEFSQVEWFINDVSAGISDYLYTADNNIINKYVHASLVRQGETQAIPTCPILISDRNHRGGQYGVRPNAAPQREPDVTIVAPKKGEYYVFDAAGYRCGSGAFYDGETPMSLPAVPGYYIVVLKAEDGYMTTEKVVIY